MPTPIGNTRHCYGCNSDLDLEKDFAFKNKARGTRHTRCRACQAKTAHKHYTGHRSEYITRALTHAQERVHSNQTKAFSYLGFNPCGECGEGEPNRLRMFVGGKELTLGKIRAMRSAELEQVLPTTTVTCVDCLSRHTFSWTL